MKAAVSEMGVEEADRVPEWARFRCGPAGAKGLKWGRVAQVWPRWNLNGK